MYSAKFICGIQKQLNDTRFARGFYATSINVHNPNSGTAAFAKKLAFSLPPGGEKPGRIVPIAREKLLSDEAMEVDCQEITRRFFPAGVPVSLVERLVVIESDSSLDVTGVYTASGIDQEGRRMQSVSALEVEQINERKIVK